MKYNIEFKTEQSIENTKIETLTYFKEHGFKLVKETATALEFKRGSLLKNMFTFNPLKWKSNIIVTFLEDEVIADFQINTSFQMITSKEKDLWNKFVSNFQKTIQTGKSFTSENKENLSTTKKSNLKYLGSAMIGAIVLGIPGAIISYYLEMESVFFIISGIIGGAMFFMLKQIEKDNKNANN